jgi:Terminase large subunit, T4likevirus-type, N-terminal
MEITSQTLSELRDLLPYLTQQERVELDKLLLTRAQRWVPLPGPQTEAYYSEADELLYGGAAGGGKTDLVLGLSLTQHLRSIIFRREGTQHKGNVERMADILGSRDCYQSQDHIWRIDNRVIEFGSCKDPDDVEKHQGQPKDLVVFDEICHFLKMQYMFLKGWNRTTKKGQRCRVICTGNPPTTAEGQWVIEHWGAWLDRNHPHPALPGELRWYAMLDGVDTEVADGTWFVHKGETIRPKSRTFIPSKVSDNLFLAESDYVSTLQALPEPLRSQMLYGDYLAGMEDNPWQVIPTRWVELAQARWKEGGMQGPMTAIGLDVSRGGKDVTVAAPRYGNFYDSLKRAPGKETPDGAHSAGLAILHRKDNAVVNVDVIGVGSSAFDNLMDNGIPTNPINGAAGSKATDRSGQMRFVNKRAALYWGLREKLDPEYGSDVAIPPDNRLKADLCAPTWRPTARGIQVESKEDIAKRLKRSTDDGDAVVYASADSEGIFDRSALKFIEVRPETLNIYILVSRSSSRRAKLNNTAIAVIGVDYARNKVLLDGYCHDMTMAERWLAVRTLRRHWQQQPGIQTVIVGYEHFTHLADFEYCEAQMLADKDTFEITELVWPQENEASENDRIARLVPDFTRGAFRLIARTDKETSLQAKTRQQGRAHLIVKPARRKDHNGEIYTLNNKFCNEYLIYPAVMFADLLDASSRIYDMDYQAPVIVNDKDLEPESYED